MVKRPVLNRYLQKSGIKTAISSGIKIGEMIKPRKEENINKESIIYSIPCNGCNKVYIGETGRGMTKRLYEHKADVRRHNSSNSLVVHIDQHQGMIFYTSR